MSSDTICSHLITQSPPALPLVFSLERVGFPVMGQFRFLQKFCQSVFFLNPVALHHVGADVSGEFTTRLPVHPFHAGDHLSLAPGFKGFLPFIVTDMFSRPATSVCNGGFISLLLRRKNMKISCLGIPRSLSDGKTLGLLFCCCLNFPNHSLTILWLFGSFLISKLHLKKVF